MCGLVVVRDLARGVDDVDPGGGIAERRADLARRAKEDAWCATGCGIGGGSCDLGEAAVSAEGVYRDCCDGPSEEPLSATTWRPP